MAAAGASGVGAGVAGGGPADGASEKRHNVRCDNRQWFEPVLVCTHGTHILLENF